MPAPQAPVNPGSWPPDHQSPPAPKHFAGFVRVSVWRSLRAWQRDISSQRTRGSKPVGTPHEEECTRHGMPAWLSFQRRSSTPPEVSHFDGVSKAAPPPGNGLHAPAIETGGRLPESDPRRPGGGSTFNYWKWVSLRSASTRLQPERRSRGFTYALERARLATTAPSHFRVRGEGEQVERERRDHMGATEASPDSRETLTHLSPGATQCAGLGRRV